MSSRVSPPDTGRLVLNQPPRSGATAPSSRATAVAARGNASTPIRLLTGVINILTLSGALFMLQVYDRVLPSRSVPTLLALFALVAALYAFQGGLDMTRGRLLVRIGAFLDEQLSTRVYDAVVRL